MRRYLLAFTVLFALALPTTAGAKNAPPQPNPIASFVGVDGNPKVVSLGGGGVQIVNGETGVDGTVPAGADVLVAQRGGCQEQCAVSWTIDGTLAHTGEVALVGFGTLNFTTSFASGVHVVRETLTTSKRGVVVSSLSVSLTLTVAG